MTDSTGSPQADYPELYRRLAREIIKQEGRIAGDAQAFTASLVNKLRAEGYQITPAIKDDLTAYLTAMQDSIKAGIVKAAELALLAEGIKTLRASISAANLAEQAYKERWPDGLRLSDRLWNWREDVRTGLTKVVREGINSGDSISKTVYAMQRTIERAHGENRFKIVEKHADDWVKELHEAAVGLIHNPEDRALWNQVVGEAEDRILELKTTGTRHAAERVLDQMKKAVLKGKEQLADNAVKWWLYDKQLYHLQRIVRTEMATALHRGVIASAENDDSIIGFQWSLSASHPVTDICDYYADIEMGLGKGVWTKEAVPRHKAHPHCVLGDTLIDNPGTIVAATKAFYQGAVVEIITRNARRLTCTLNHSILTGSGWVDAQFLNKGQQIITTTGSKSGALNPDNYDMPASIEQIFDALLESGGMTASAVSVASEHFHGDGRFMNGDVQIVHHVDGFLLGEGDTGILQGFAGTVAFDEIVDIRKRDFSGFVYDLMLRTHSRKSLSFQDGKRKTRVIHRLPDL